MPNLGPERADCAPDYAMREAPMIVAKGFSKFLSCSGLAPRRMKSIVPVGQGGLQGVSVSESVFESHQSKTARRRHLGLSDISYRRNPSI